MVPWAKKAQTPPVPGMVTIEFWSELPTFNARLELSVSLLMASSTALANEGLFDLTPRPLLTQAVLLPIEETCEEPDCNRANYNFF